MKMMIVKLGKTRLCRGQNIGNKSIHVVLNRKQSLYAIRNSAWPNGIRDTARQEYGEFYMHTRAFN